MRRIKELAVVFGIILALLTLGVVIPCSFEGVRETTTLHLARWRVQDILSAVHEYHADNGKLPPAVVYGKDGKPLYSWRVVLLRYLEQEPFKGAEVHKHFKFDEPWDSPHNKELAKQTPAPYQILADEGPGLTCFQVLVGPGTAFEKPGLTFKDFPDGLSNTILVVEAKEPVPWSKPVDLAYDPNGPLPEFGGHFTLPHRFLYCKYGRKPFFFAGFGDAAIKYIPAKTSEKIIRAMITRNGGEQENTEDLEW